MDEAVLDTDTLSEILKQRDPVIAANAANYFSIHGHFTFSVFTRFEIERGYKEKRAARQLAKFKAFCGRSIVVPLTEAIFERAADLWVMARRGGHPHGDADILIAATAIESRVIL